MKTELSVDTVVITPAQYAYEVRDRGVIKRFETYKEAELYIQTRKEEETQCYINRRFPNGQIGEVVVFELYDDPDFGCQQSEATYPLYEIAPDRIKVKFGVQIQDLIQKLGRRKLMWFVVGKDDAKIAAVRGYFKLAHEYGLEKDLDLEEQRGVVNEIFESVGVLKSLFDAVEKGKQG